MPNLYLLFSHTLTDEQKEDARHTLKVQDFISLPEGLQSRWSEVPPDSETIAEHLQPVFVWLLDQANPGDYLLVQGDFGVVCLTVAYVRKHGLIPVYSTTKRETTEIRLPDGTVNKQSTFRHVRYRRYQT